MAARVLLAACAAYRLIGLASAVKLTPTNYVDRTEDKQALILFTGKTKSGRLIGQEMLAVFERLEEWVLEEEHDYVAIGHVECSSPEGTPICEYMGIMNMPAGTTGPIYWGNPWSLAPFPTQRTTYDDLERFILGALRPECEPDNDEYCTDDELERIRTDAPASPVASFCVNTRLSLGEYGAWSAGKLDSKISQLDKARKEAERVYDEGITTLKARGVELESAYPANEAELKERLALMRAVLAAK